MLMGQFFFAYMFYIVRISEKFSSFHLLESFLSYIFNFNNHLLPLYLENVRSQA